MSVCSNILISFDFISNLIMKTTLNIWCIWPCIQTETNDGFRAYYLLLISSDLTNNFIIFVCPQISAALHPSSWSETTSSNRNHLNNDSLLHFDLRSWGHWIWSCCRGCSIIWFCIVILDLCTWFLEYLGGNFCLGFLQFGGIVGSRCGVQLRYSCLF